MWEALSQRRPGKSYHQGKIAARVSADTRATPAFSSNVPPQHGMKNSHEILKLVQFQTSSKPFDTETVTTLGLEFLPSAWQYISTPATKTSVECQSTFHQTSMKRVNTSFHQSSATNSVEYCLARIGKGQQSLARAAGVAEPSKTRVRQFEEPASA